MWFTESASPNDFRSEAIGVTLIPEGGTYAKTADIGAAEFTVGTKYHLGPYRVPYFAGKPASRILATIVLPDGDPFRAEACLEQSINGDANTFTSIGSPVNIEETAALQSVNFAGEYVRLTFEPTAVPTGTINVILKAS